MFIFVADIYYNSINQKHKAMKNTTLTPDQAGTVLDLVEDQILVQRYNLGRCLIDRVQIADLTHLRHLRRELKRAEAERLKAEAIEMQEGKTMNDYEKMKNEIRRLHQVCRIKDQQMTDAINTIKALMIYAKLTPELKTYYERSIIDFEANQG